MILKIQFSFFPWILNIPNGCILTEMSRVHWNLKINYCHDSELKLPYHKFLSNNPSIPGHPACHHVFKSCDLLLTPSLLAHLYFCGNRQESILLDRTLLVTIINVLA